MSVTTSATQGPSIKTTRRTDVSFLSRISKAFIKPIRPRLAQPGSPLPGGSPQLTPCKTKCPVYEHQQDGIWLYTFEPPILNPDAALKRRDKHTIYYFAGGGFRSPPSKEHWKMCSHLALRLQNRFRLSVVSYPLAPNTPAEKAMPLLQTWLRKTCENAAEAGSRLTLMGDSSGGNIVINLGIWWSSSVAQHDLPNPLTNIFVLTPPTDFRNTNPDIAKIAPKDAVLTPGLIQDAADAWLSKTNPIYAADSPQMSPLLADLMPLRHAGIYVHGVVGTFDVLAPDALLFKDRLEQEGIPGEWLVWEGQMHCFPLTGSRGVREGREGVEWMVETMRRHEQGRVTGHGL